MVADLLEAHQRGEHEPATPHAARLLGVGEQLVDDLLVHRRLLAGELGVGDLFDLVGQIGQQPAVGLGAPEDERLREAAQSRRGIGVAVAFDRRAELLPEPAESPEQAGVHGVEDRPQLAQPVLDRRAGEGDLLSGTQLADGARCLGVRVLHHLRLVEDHGRPFDAAEVFEVAGQQPVRGDHDLAFRIAPEQRVVARRRRARRQRLRVLPWWICTSSFGVNRCASLLQLRTTLSGHTTRCGPGRSTRWANVVAVLPRPMSSARQPPRPSLARNCIHDRPRRW